MCDGIYLFCGGIYLCCVMVHVCGVVVQIGVVVVVSCMWSCSRRVQRNAPSWV